MPKLKVLPLEFWMTLKITRLQHLVEFPFKTQLPLDGHFRQGNNVWVVIDGQMYLYRTDTRRRTIDQTIQQYEDRREFISHRHLSEVERTNYLDSDDPAIRRKGSYDLVALECARIALNSRLTHKRQTARNKKILELLKSRRSTTGLDKWETRTSQTNKEL